MARIKRQYSEGSGRKRAARKTERSTNALAKMYDIIEDAKVAEVFFYEEMAPKMAAIARNYKDSCNIDITAEDVSTAAYIACWEHDWARLRAFKGNTTIHAWVARIASQATTKLLVEEHFIEGVRNTKANDYRLTTPFQTWHDCIDEGNLCENHLALRDILCSIFRNEDWDMNVEALVACIIKELDWTEVQEEVWRARFLKHTPSKELAEKFHVRNTWIDNTYSRLKRQFNIAVRMWWKKVS